MSVIDTQVGHTYYVNGIQVTFQNISQKQEKAERTDICDEIYLGAKNKEGHFETNTAIDEVKYMYRSLTPEGTFLFMWIISIITISVNWWILWKSLTDYKFGGFISGYDAYS